MLSVCINLICVLLSNRPKPPSRRGLGTQRRKRRRSNERPQRTHAGAIFSTRLVMGQPCSLGSVGRGDLSDFNVF